MPRLNGTGPEGKGPKTGRGLGKCKEDSYQEGYRQIRKRIGKTP